MGQDITFEESLNKLDTLPSDENMEEIIKLVVYCKLYSTKENINPNKISQYLKVYNIGLNILETYNDYKLSQQITKNPDTSQKFTILKNCQENKSGPNFLCYVILKTKKIKYNDDDDVIKFIRYIFAQNMENTENTKYIEKIKNNIINIEDIKELEFIVTEFDSSTNSITYKDYLKCLEIYKKNKQTIDEWFNKYFEICRNDAECKKNYASRNTQYKNKYLKYEQKYLILKHNYM